MSELPMYSFTSHIAGKNAKVDVYQDHIEWTGGGGLSGGKLTAGVMTGGLSLLATGFKSKRKSTDMIPIRAITGITTKRELTKTIVQISASGNLIDFRATHSDAEQFKSVVQRLLAAK